MKRKIAIVGGDVRNLNLAIMLSNEGYEVGTYGFENAEDIVKNDKIYNYETIDDCINNNDIIIGAIPFSSNKKEINMLFTDNVLECKDFFDKISEKKIVIAGNIEEKYFSIANEKNFKLIDILKREELGVLNAISTAEGTINIAISETTANLHGSNILVMGFGKVGKVLAKMLDGIGANVYCEARKNVDLAWIKAYGYKPIRLDDLDKQLEKFDIIINTIPVLVLNNEKLHKVKKSCLIIDIASNPGGVDRKAAKENNIRTIWALSLP